MDCGAASCPASRRRSAWATPLGGAAAATSSTWTRRRSTSLPEASLQSGEDPLGIVATARRVIFVTVWPSAESLRRGLDAEALPGLVRWGRGFQGRRYAKIRNLYEDADRIDGCYQAWLERARHHTRARHVLVRGDEVQLIARGIPTLGSATATA